VVLRREDLGQIDEGEILILLMKTFDEESDEKKGRRVGKFTLANTKGRNVLRKDF